MLKWYLGLPKKKKNKNPNFVLVKQQKSHRALRKALAGAGDAQWVQWQSPPLHTRKGGSREPPRPQNMTAATLQAREDLQIRGSRTLSLCKCKVHNWEVTSQGLSGMKVPGK